LEAPAARKQFSRSIAIVIGQHRGTGVMAPATSATEAKSTSPASEPSRSRLTPTSITQAPGLTMRAVTSFARPTAATSISALRATFQVGRLRMANGDGGVFLQQEQRERCRRCRAADDHRVAARDRDGAVLEQPHHARRRAGQHARLAREQRAEISWHGSIDILGRRHGLEHALRIDLLGSGSCTRMPCTSASSLSASTRSIRASSLTLAGSS